MALIHDDDADGVCSAVLLSKAIYHKTSEMPEVYSAEHAESLTGSFLAQVMRREPGYVVFSDVPALPQTLLSEAAEHSRILVLDHHSIEPYQNVTYANPRLLDPRAYIPSSCLAHSVSKQCGLPELFCWIAGIGVLADHGVSGCLDMMETIGSLYPELLGLTIADEDLMDHALLGQLTKIVSYAPVASPKNGASTAFRALNLSQAYHDLLEGVSPDTRQMLEWYSIVEAEFNRILADARANSTRVSPHLVYYRFESNLRIKSLVANYLPRIFKQDVVLVIQGIGPFTYVSVRRGSEMAVDLRQLTAIAIGRISGATGGGHPEASAARIPAEKIDAFVTNVKDILAQARAN